MPAEHEIMRLHGVSRGTVRRAMTELEFDGYIHRHPGRGTFVARRGRGRRTPMRWAFLRLEREGGGRLLDGLEAYARTTAALLTVEHLTATGEGVRDAVDRLVRSGAEGVILDAGEHGAARAPAPRGGKAPAAPLVLVREPLAGFDAPLVTLDHAAIGRQTVQHLLDLGHRRVACLGPPKGFAAERQRAGCRACVAEVGLSLIEPRRRQDAIEDEPYEIARRLLAADPRPTAIIAGDDVAAAGVYRAARIVGLRIPRDLSVIAAVEQGRSLAAALDPPLTVWCPPQLDARLGRTAGEVLAAMIDKRWPPHVDQVLIDPAPLPRGSAAGESGGASGGASGGGAGWGV